MSSPEWKLEFYEEDGREPVLDFLRGLGEVKKQALAAALRNVLAYEGIGVCGSSWGKWVQGAPGIFEFRIRHDAGTILRQRGLPVPKELEGEARSCCACSAMPMARRRPVAGRLRQGQRAEHETAERRDQACQATPDTLEGRAGSPSQAGASDRRPTQRRGERRP